MKLTELVLLALALSTASARKCNPKKDTSCCRTPPRPSCPAAAPAPSRRRNSLFRHRLMIFWRVAGNRKSNCWKKVQKKPTKCAKTKFGGKCRKVCDKYWGAISEIEFCTAVGYTGVCGLAQGPAGADGRGRAPEEAARRVGRLEDGRPVRLHPVQGRRDGGGRGDDGALPAEAAGVRRPRRRGHPVPVAPRRLGTTPPKNRCTSDYEYCTAHPPSPPPSPRPPPPPAVPPGGAVVTIFETEITITGDCGSFEPPPPRSPPTSTSPSTGSR